MVAKRKTKAKTEVVTPADPVFPCNFCSKVFKKESTLAAHMCVQKQRYIDRNEKHVILGFWIYQRFYDISYSGRKPQTYEGFCKSNFYLDFTKFARYLLEINAVNPQSFVEFVIKNGVKIARWTSPPIYETYLRELNKRETSDAALERNFLLMQQWANDNGEEWTDFFRKVAPALAVLWIRSGRISPWVLYTASSAVELFERMSEEQFTLIQEAIDPEFWQKKLAQNENEVAFIRETLEAAQV